MRAVKDTAGVCVRHQHHASSVRARQHLGRVAWVPDDSAVAELPEPADRHGMDAVRPVHHVGRVIVGIHPAVRGGRETGVSCLADLRAGWSVRD
eukprot:1613066-Rhodomonas_salina.1